jgi:hypothetical protein
MENNRETAVGAATPHRLIVSPQQATAGASLIAHGGSNGQHRSVFANYSTVLESPREEVAHER